MPPTRRREATRSVRTIAAWICRQLVQPALGLVTAPQTAGAPRASASAKPWTNRLHRLMRHFGPNHATDFFTTTEFVSRRVVIPAGARASRAEPGPGESPQPFVRPQGNAEGLRRLGEVRPSNERGWT